MHNASHLSDWLVEHDGYVYAPGRKRFRIDVDTLEAESLVAGVVPREWEHLAWIGSSQRHGLIAYKEGKLYRVEITDQHLPDIPAPYR